MTSEATSFPPLPHVEAQWTTIYMEPLPGSGERITLAVAAIAVSGKEFCLTPALPFSALQCLYDTQAKRIHYFAEAALESLNAHLDSGEPISAWIPPFLETFFVGPLSQGYGHSLNEIAQDGLQLTSSVAATRGDKFEFGIPDELMAQRNSDRWGQSVKRAIVSSRPHWAERFNHSFQTRIGAAPIRIDYAGPRMAAHFLKLSPSSLSQKHKDGKGKLFDLESLRLHDTFAKRSSYELLLWRPVEPSDEYSEGEINAMHSVAQDLEYFADKHDLRVETMASTEAAAQRLLHNDSY